MNLFSTPILTFLCLGKNNAFKYGTSAEIIYVNKVCWLLVVAHPGAVFPKRLLDLDSALCFRARRKEKYYLSPVSFLLYICIIYHQMLLGGLPFHT